MSDMNNDLQSDTLSMQKDIEDLRSKYDNLTKEVERLESNKTAFGDEIKQIHSEFEQINKSMDEVLQKLNSLSNDNDEINTEREGENVTANSMMRFFSNPLRKLVVGTLSTVYAVADKTIEKTSGFRESLEDIVAEAQYSHKKKKMTPMENS